MQAVFTEGGTGSGPVSGCRAAAKEHTHLPSCNLRTFWESRHVYGPCASVICLAVSYYSRRVVEEVVSVARAQGIPLELVRTLCGARPGRARTVTENSLTRGSPAECTVRCAVVSSNCRRAEEQQHGRLPKRITTNLGTRVLLKPRRRGWTTVNAACVSRTQGEQLRCTRMSLVSMVVPSEYQLYQSFCSRRENLLGLLRE